MTRAKLALIYLDWINNYLTIAGYAAHYGLYESEAETLINLARSCYENPHPDA
jgi:hypothetical protein